MTRRKFKAVRNASGQFAKRETNNAPSATPAEPLPEELAAEDTAEARRKAVHDRIRAEQKAAMAAALAKPRRHKYGSRF